MALIKESEVTGQNIVSEDTMAALQICSKYLTKIPMIKLLRQLQTAEGRDHDLKECKDFIDRIFPDVSLNANERYDSYDSETLREVALRCDSIIEEGSLEEAGVAAGIKVYIYARSQ